jgi:hypothetical protein
VNRVNIFNSGSSAAGVFVSGVHQVVGGIDGSGKTQGNADSDLTVDHVNQTSLVIGASAAFTLAPSDANGNPMAMDGGAPTAF